MAAALLAHLWQSTLCAMLAWGLTLALRRHSARTRYLIWLATSIKFLIPFSALVALGLVLRPSSPIGLEFLPAPLVSAAVSMTESPGAAHGASSDGGWLATEASAALLMLWVAGMAVILLRWLISWLRTRAAVRAADIHPMDVPIDVKVSELFNEPGVFGIGEPVLLLPRDVITRMRPDELAAVINHEMCHVRHRDNLAAAVHMLIEAIFWFHPLVWWIGRRLLEERERACDEAVIELGATPRTYAEGILKACRVAFESKLGVVAGATGADLKQRIEAILKNRPARRLGVIGKAGLVAIGSAVLVLPVSTGLATPRPPAWNAISSSAWRFDSTWIETTPDTGAESQLVLRAGRLSMRNVSLRKLIGVAYGTNERVVFGGPAWLDQRYDIEASSKRLFAEDDSAGVSAAHRRMILRLLQDEFKLEFVERNIGS